MARRQYATGIAPLVAVLFLAAGAHAQYTKVYNESYQLHASGTSNPAQLMWRVSLKACGHGQFIIIQHTRCLCGRLFIYGSLQHVCAMRSLSSFSPYKRATRGVCHTDVEVA